MKVDCGDHRIRDAIGMLSNQAGDHPGQYVAGASCRHAWIPRGVHPDGTVGLRDQGSVALEDNDQFIFAGKAAGHVQAVVLNGGNGGTGESRHLTGMRRDDQSARDIFQFLRVTLEGVEAICNDEIKVKIIFVNVDIAHDYEHDPKPRSRKGAGSERMCSGNLFPDLPRYAPAQAKGWSIYYLMVDEHGAAELSCTVVRNGTFVAPVERIFLSDGSDIDGEAKLPLDDKDAANDFDPKVARK